MDRVGEESVSRRVPTPTAHQDCILFASLDILRSLNELNRLDMSSIRRPAGPVRQLSLQQQQPPRHQQVRRQRSAEDDKSLQIYANPIRTKVESERPKVRIAWSERHAETDRNQVEVVARQISSRSRAPIAKSSKITTRTLVGEKATILYSRQELAERLRLAWKERENRKSNIDIFLATRNVVEERCCDSRLSTCANIAISKREGTSQVQENDENDSAVIDEGSVGTIVDRESESIDIQSRVTLTTEPDVEARHRRSTNVSRTNDRVVAHCDSVVEISDRRTEGSNRDDVRENEKKVSQHLNLEGEIGKASDRFSRTSRYFESTVQCGNKEEKSRDVDDAKADGQQITDGNIERITNDDADGESKKLSSINIDSTDWHSSILSLSSSTVKQENVAKMVCKDLSQGLSSARIKRANFHNCTNKAFVVPVMEKFTRDKLVNKDNTCERTRRTSSAPPQRRLTGPPGKTQVNIVIDAPAIAKIDSLSRETCKLLERKCNTACTTTCNEAPVKTAISNRTIKSAPIRRRAKSAKRRVTNGGSCKNGVEDQDSARRGNRGKIYLETKIPDVVTMVSLVSSADSDSDIDQNSPRDDKLIYELRNKLPTTPIIKKSGNPAILTTRKSIKSVSFQQDSFDVDKEECTKEEKKLSQTRYTVICRGNGTALPVPEEVVTWRPDVIARVLPAHAHIDENDEILENPVTDREKRCLAVPIGDLRDKKRKILRTRNIPPRAVVQRQSIMTETNETCRQADNSIVENNGRLLLQAPTLFGTPISKVDINSTESTSEVDSKATAIPTEPQFQTTKEKECWHLYRRMCDKGVCISFDTVLRGMLTPTEYRLRQKELTKDC